MKINLHKIQEREIKYSCRKFKSQKKILREIATTYTGYELKI